MDFHELIADPERVVTGIYKQFGFAISDDFAHVLKQANEVSGRHESAHAYSLEDIGMTRSQILSDYQDVFTLMGIRSRPGSQQPSFRRGTKARP